VGKVGCSATLSGSGNPTRLLSQGRIARKLAPMTPVTEPLRGLSPFQGDYGPEGSHGNSDYQGQC